jgi:general secretion pathway protein D
MTKTPARFAVILGALVFIGAYAQAPPAAAPPPQAPPAAAPQGTPVGGLNLINASLLEVISLLANELKLNYVLDASIHGGSVTINTYGIVRDVDLRPLLETILRMNNLAMVQVGNMYRIVPAANVARQPISPVSSSDPTKFADDEHLVLNLVFLRYMTSAEMKNILAPFSGDGSQITSYDAGNLLIILDNSRNMRRTLDLINMFDSDSFAGQRVRAFDVKNGRPSDIAKDLETVFKAYALSTGTKGGGAVQFVPLDRINVILAVAPNPGVFTEVETWLSKLDLAAKVTAGSIDNYVYKLKYGRAEVLGTVIGQLYGVSVISAFGNGSGLYGGITGNSGYPATGILGGVGSGSYGGGGISSFGSGQNSGLFGVYPSAQQQQQQYVPSTPFNQVAAGGTVPAAGAPGASTDQTGTFLTASSGGGAHEGAPHIVPNPFDNTLLVQSTPAQWEQIRNLLEKLDVSPRQVLIDAKIYEVTLTGDLSAGVEAYLQKRGATNPSGLTNHQLTGSSNAAGVAGLILSAGTLVGASRELLAMLQASEITTKAKVISAPSVIATDSIPASITVGSSVPTLSSQGVNPGVVSGGNSVFTNTVSNVSTGVGLNILARINPSGVVTMVINQSVTAPTPTTSSAIDSPSFSQRNVSTQVTVDDNDTIAIGGIIDESNTETSGGIPFIHRIPWLGAAFGSKSTNKSRTELIIFLTPHVIYDTHHISDATEELKEKVKGLQKLIEKNP